jgi:hypothetical protein
VLDEPAASRVSGAYARRSLNDLGRHARASSRCAPCRTGLLDGSDRSAGSAITAAVLRRAVVTVRDRWPFQQRSTACRGRVAISA